MHKLYYQPEGHWFGDCMPYGKDDEFYLYHQRDTRKPGPFGEPFGWALATTKDFVTYKDLGDAVPRGGDDEQDQFIFAGSVFRAEGRYHIFYTGYNRDYPKAGKPSQVLMHAVSDDLVHWEKTQDTLQLAPQPGYDPNDWRDPFVMYDEDAGAYLLILGARKLDGQRILNGCTVQFTSKNLVDWTFRGEFWAPDILTMHEMPDLFKIGDWWYLVISEYSDRNKIIYRMSRSLKGPWIAPADDAFDGRAYYAGRTFCLNGHRVLFGWVPTREDCDDRKNFEWGGTFMPHEIVQRADGSLGVKLPDSLWNAFDRRRTLPDIELRTLDSRKEAVMVRGLGDLYSFECDVRFPEGTRSFAIKIYNDEATGEGYQFLFLLNEGRVVFEKTPNWPWFQLMNIGLERPVQLAPDQSHRIRVIVDDTIATLYVDDIALNVRFYGKPGDSLSAFVTDGGLSVFDATVSNALKAR